MVSLIVLILIGQLDYLAMVIRTILSLYLDQQIKKNGSTPTATSRNSLALRLTHAWLSITLYSYVKDSSATPLYNLYKTLKDTIEKSPVDSLTHKSKYNMCEESLLTQDCNPNKVVSTLRSPVNSQIRSFLIFTNIVELSSQES